MIIEHKSIEKKTKVTSTLYDSALKSLMKTADHFIAKNCDSDAYCDHIDGSARTVNRCFQFRHSN